MRKAFLFLILVGMALTSNATKVQGFSDNEDITVELSKNNYNRIFVANDTIVKTHFPENTLRVQNDDNSVYVDLLSTEPFTVFFTTEAGHHFSLTVKPIDALGQTIQLLPKTATAKARQFEAKTPRDETITKVIQAMMNNQTPLGYGVKSTFSSYRPLNKELTFKISKQFVGEAYTGEVMTVYNRSNKPVSLDESWFKDSGTRAVALSQKIIAPKGTQQIYVVKEQSHA
jgi:conjugal transfer pilus assembly protein TraK